MAEVEYPRIDYTSRDFPLILESLINFVKARHPDSITDFTESEFGMAMMELWAWVGDMFSFTTDMHANESYLVTCRQRYNAVNIVKLLGYTPRPPSAASVELYLEAGESGFSQDCKLAKGTQISVGDLTFELLADYVLPANTTDAGPGSASGVAGPVFSEGTTFTDRLSGTGEPFQSYALGNFPLIQNSEEAFVDGFLWDRIDALVFAGDAAKYAFEYDGNNAATIRFGDGISGRIPPSGIDNIEVVYRVGGGTKGNIAAWLIDTQLSGTLADGITQTQVHAQNPLPASGGADAESLDSIKFNAPRHVRTHLNAITKNDYDFLASTFIDPSYGSIAKAVVYPRYGRTNSSANEVDVYVWARTSGGELTSASIGLKEALLAHLNSRKVIVVDLFIHDGLIKPIDLDVRIYTSQASRKPQDIKNEALQKIQAHFQREELQPGQAFFVSELYREIMSVAGILQANVSRPETQVIINDSVQSTFVIGTTTDLVLVTGGMVEGQFAGGLVRFTSGTQNGRSYAILANTANTIRVDSILTSVIAGDTCEISSQPDEMPDIQVADNEIYKLGALSLKVLVRPKDFREGILIL